MFDFDAYGFEPYLSEFARRTRLTSLNSAYAPLVGDKLAAYLYFSAVGTPTPRVHGYAHGGELFLLDARWQREGLPALLRHEGRLVVKPRGGSGGDGFHVLDARDDQAFVDGSPCTDLRPLLRGRVVVTDFIEQHDYARAIFPDATNTLRLISLRDVEGGRPFVVAASQRFGTRRSQPVDNTTKGGLMAGIDIATGALGPLAAFPGNYTRRSDTIRWFDRHPDTGALVRGNVIPFWEEIIAEIERSMGALLGFDLVGWDVIVTPDGFSVLEANTRPDINPQVFGPYAQHDRARRFLEDRKLVGGRRSRRSATAR